MAKKKWLIIDAHTHFLPKEAAAKSGIVGNFNYAALITGDLKMSYALLEDIEKSLQIMEDAGIDMAVLNQSAWSPQGLEMCEVMNDGYAKVMRNYPGKFIMCGHIPPQAGQDVVDEVERCINELGFKGMSLVTSLPDVTLDSTILWPVYKKISKLDVPIVIHPTVRFPLWGGDAKYGLRRSVSREYEIAKTVVEVMYGVLKDFPDLKFLMPHYGGGIPSLKGRLRAQFKPDDWNIPVEKKNKSKTPRELAELGLDKAFDALFDKLYFDMAGAGGGWIPSIKMGLLALRTDRTCFGTDYPFELGAAEDIRTFVDNIKGLEIPEGDRRLILGENIKNLFKV